MVYYRPKRSCGQGYVFTRVRDSVHRGLSVSVHARIPPATRSRHPKSRHPLGADTPRADTPLGADNPLSRQPPHQIPTTSRSDTPLEQTPSGSRHPPEQTPPQEQTPPWSRHPPGADTPQKADSSIRSMSGRYASYWNAFLLLKTSLIVSSKNNSFSITKSNSFFRII